MYLNFAEDIKSRVTMQDLCDLYGITVNRQGKAICPFHNDAHPSMHVYNNQRGWWCFTCNSGGSVIDFVMKFFGLDYLSACKKLDDDFNLGLNIGRPMTVEQHRKASQQAELRRIEKFQQKKERQAIMNEYDRLCDLWVRLDKLKREKAPKAPEEGFEDEYVFVLKTIDHVSYLLDNVCDKMHDLGM